MNKINPPAVLQDMAVHFNHCSATWGSAKTKEYAETLVQSSPFKANMRIADIGCGTGVLLPFLLKTEPTAVYAIDLSSDMLLRARANCQDARVYFMHTDVLEAALPALDAAVAYNSYPHFLDKALFAKKMAEQIQPGGFLLIAHDCSRAKINTLHKDKIADHLFQDLKSPKQEFSWFEEFFSLERVFDDCDSYSMLLRRNVS